MNINSAEELAKFIGKDIWLVTCFQQYNGSVYNVIGNTHIAKWTVGALMNLEGEAFDETLEGPWFCFEQTKTRMKGEKECRFIFNVDDYTSKEHRLFATEKAANQYRMIVKMQNGRAKIDFNPMDQYFVFEGTSIAMEDFLAGNIPTFGKDAWVKDET